MDDDAKLRFGDSQDLQIYHDSNHSYIEDSGTGDLKLKASIVEVQNTDATVGAKFTGDGSVELNHNGSKKLETTSSGATVTGDLSVSGSITAGGMNIVQNAYPVGSIYMNATSATNPNTLLGFGTWVRFGEGRMVISQHSSNSRWDSAEETGGSETITLTTSQIPSHSHFTSSSGNGFPNTVQANGALTVTSNSNGGAGNNDYNFFGVSGQANQSPTSNTGGGGSHDNMPPFITVYMWKRTA